jgi:hypothetical protein
MCTPQAAGVGLSGGLDELGLADLVEMISLGAKSGRLELADARGVPAGWLAFRGGRLVGGTCGVLSGEKAFYGLLTLKAGTFFFDPQAQLDHETCDMRTESLLMEGMRRIDEIMRLRAALPAPALARLLGGEAADATEARVLAYLGPGARTVGDIIEGMLVGGELDEYDALSAVARLAQRGVVRVETPAEAGPLPQPELEA